MVKDPSYGVTIRSAPDEAQEDGVFRLVSDQTLAGVRNARVFKTAADTFLFAAGDPGFRSAVIWKDGRRLCRLARVPAGTGNIWCVEPLEREAASRSQNRAEALGEPA